MIAADPITSRRSAEGPASRLHWLAWQGWRLPVPRDWNVVRIEGDWTRGMLLLADLQRPRMGLRWDSLSAAGDAEAAVRSAMSAEVGSAAFGQATRVAAMPDWSFAMRHLEAEPPGRDVWIGHSAVSGRIAQLSCPTDDRRHRDLRALPQNLADTAAGEELPWSILDMSCCSPAGWKLASHHLMAGDLRLIFARGKDRLVIRQVTPARLALARQAIEKWLAQHPLERKRGDRMEGQQAEITVHVCGRSIGGLRQAWTGSGLLHRLTQSASRRIEVTALHDADRDRLWIIESPESADAVIDGLGWADEIAPEAQR